MRHVLRGVVVVDLEVEVLGEDFQLVCLVRQVGPGILEVVLEMVELPDHVFEALGSRGNNLENTLVGVHKGCNVLEHRANLGLNGIRLFLHLQKHSSPEWFFVRRSCSLSGSLSWSERMEFFIVQVTMPQATM